MLVVAYLNRCGVPASIFVLSISFCTSLGADSSSMLPSVSSKDYYREVQRPETMPSDAELENRNIRIGKIIVVPDNIFNTNKSNEDTWLFQLGNRLHITTRETTVRQQLLFKPGELYNGRKLAETERLLRSNSYLYNARVRPVLLQGNKVNIEVTTKDVWTLKPGISLSRSGGKNTSALEFEEKNLLGTGSTIRVSSKNAVDRDSLSIFFRDKNLGSSWWDFSAGYSENSDGESNAIALELPFYSLDSRRAGGISWSGFDRVDSRYDLGRVTEQYRVEEKDLKIFYGWSKGFSQGWVNRFTAGVTVDENDFSSLINTSKPTVTLPEDRKLVYPWFSFERRQDEFRKGHNRDQIHRTEDISLGWRFLGSLGLALPEFGSDQESLVVGSFVRKGLLIGDKQSLVWSSRLNGRYEDHRWENVLLKGQFQYHYRFSNQSVSYLAFGFDASKNLDSDRQLLLGGDSGLRGYPLRYQTGASRWLVTAEQRFFSNWFPFRLFNLGAAIFADAGEARGDNSNASQSLGILKDIGFGIRVGNSRSGLGSVIHFDFAFPLDRNNDIEDFQFLIKTKNSF